MSQPLTIRIPIRNKNGDVVGEKEVVSFAGLLATAHQDDGLESIETEIVQIPTEQNGSVAIVRATVKGRRGTYTGIGDADPSNVNRTVARHLLRMAETRAVGRGLRLYSNVGMIVFDEIGGDDEPDTPHMHEPVAAAPLAHAPGPMSEAQRRMLWRQALTLGYEGDAASAFLDRRLGVTNGSVVDRKVASRVIDELDAELRRGGGNRAA